MSKHGLFSNITFHIKETKAQHINKTNINKSRDLLENLHTTGGIGSSVYQENSFNFPNKCLVAKVHLTKLCENYENPHDRTSSIDILWFQVVITRSKAGRCNEVFSVL